MTRMIGHKLRKFAQDEDAATLLELAIVVPMLLMLCFGIIEFGRFGYNETAAQKATDLAARTAAVRPSACDGVSGEIVLPATFLPPQNSSPRFGSLCRFTTNGVATCATIPTQSCTLQEGIDVGNATAVEIWATVQPLVPATASPANVEVSYTFDSNLGFLGGPYTPMVTAEIVQLEFQFVTPLGALAVVAGADDNDQIATTIPFPSMSASLPAEDLGQGLDG